MKLSSLVKGGFGVIKAVLTGHVWSEDEAIVVSFSTIASSSSREWLLEVTFAIAK